MSQKNEIPILILSLLITIGLIAAGWWWFNNNSSFNLRISTSQTSGKNFTSVENVPTGLFNYGGSTSWAPIRQSIDKKFKQPVLLFDYVTYNH